jgi:hypothetical protein
MPRFVAEVEFTFECDTMEGVGAELMRLRRAAEEAGFEMRGGKAAPAPPEDDDDTGWTSYVPLSEDDG